MPDPSPITDEFITACSRFYGPWLQDLMTHFGQYRHPITVAPHTFSADRAKVAGQCREMAERRGFVIEHGTEGYRLTGFRYVPLRTVAEPGQVEVYDGQLSLVGEV